MALSEDPTTPDVVVVANPTTLAAYRRERAALKQELAGATTQKHRAAIQQELAANLERIRELSEPLDDDVRVSKPARVVTPPAGSTTVAGDAGGTTVVAGPGTTVTAAPGAPTGAVLTPGVQPAAADAPPVTSDGQRTQTSGDDSDEDRSAEDDKGDLTAKAKAAQARGNAGK